MSMRLLPKREIDRAKALDREREIAEGVKLATKVDDLRKLRAQEDAGLQKWREETLKIISADIEILAKEKSTLEEQVKNKRGELFSLSEPLDKAWKFYVSSERSEIERLKSLANIELATLQNKILEVDAIAEDLKGQELKIHKEQQEIINSRQETKKNLENATKIVEEAQAKSLKIIENAEIIKKDAEKRQISAKEREVNVQLKEASLKRKEDELETREMNALAKELLYYSPVKKNHG